MVSFCNLQYNVVQPRCGTISYNNNNNSNNNNNDNDKYNDNHNHNYDNNDNDMIVIAIVILIIPIRHDSVIDLIMFKTTFRCPHDTIIRSKYNIQQITRILM